MRESLIMKFFIIVHFCKWSWVSGNVCQRLQTFFLTIGKHWFLPHIYTDFFAICQAFTSIFLVCQYYINKWVCYIESFKKGDLLCVVSFVSDSVIFGNFFFLMPSSGWLKFWFVSFAATTSKPGKDGCYFTLVKWLVFTLVFSLQNFLYIVLISFPTILFKNKRSIALKWWVKERYWWIERPEVNDHGSSAYSRDRS